jgi:hypothetical protein
MTVAVAGTSSPSCQVFVSYTKAAVCGPPPATPCILSADYPPVPVSGATPVGNATCTIKGLFDAPALRMVGIPTLPKGSTANFYFWTAGAAGIVVAATVN